MHQRLFFIDLYNVSKVCWKIMFPLSILIVSLNTEFSNNISPLLQQNIIYIVFFIFSFLRKTALKRPLDRVWTPYCRVPTLSSFLPKMLKRLGIRSYNQ